jgi:hypothetical protein
VFGAKENYSLLRAGLSHSRSFDGDWQFRARLDCAVHQRKCW